MSQTKMQAVWGGVTVVITGSASDAPMIARVMNKAREELMPVMVTGIDWASGRDWTATVRPRGTGKTHRMLEQVRDCEAENIVVVAHSHHSAQCLKHTFWTKILKHHEARVSLNQRDRVIRPLSGLRKQVIHFAVHGEPWMTEWLGRHRDLPVIFTDHAVWELA